MGLSETAIKKIMTPNSNPHPQAPLGSPTNLETVANLHRTYCELTGLEISLDYGREWAWAEFIRRGWTADDLKLVVFEIRKGIPEKSRKPGALKFRNLIGNPDYFEEDLAEARANLRNRRPVATNKERVLESTGRPVVRTGTAKTVETVVAQITKAPELTDAGREALENLRRLKSELGK